MYKVKLNLKLRIMQFLPFASVVIAALREKQGPNGLSVASSNFAPFAIVIDIFGQSSVFYIAMYSIFQRTLYIDKKRKYNFPHILENLEGSGAKSYMTNDLLIYGENIYAFPHILGTPSSYMTLHPNPSEFLYVRKILFSFLSVYPPVPAVYSRFSQSLS
jgi:hypothetical protein